MLKYYKFLISFRISFCNSFGIKLKSIILQLILYFSLISGFSSKYSFNLSSFSISSLRFFKDNIFLSFGKIVKILSEQSPFKIFNFNCSLASSTVSVNGSLLL